MADNYHNAKKTADLKIVLIGSMNAGKTCFVTRYIKQLFDETTPNTIGACFFLKQWGPYNVAIWDTAGEERFSGLSNFYCRDAGAAIMTYDITSHSSFEELRTRFLPLLPEENCLKVVIGAKLDLVEKGKEKREVLTQEGRQFSAQINAGFLEQGGDIQIPFFETSSKTGECVAETFEYIFEKCLSSVSDEYRIKRLKGSLQLHDTHISTPDIPPKSPTSSPKKCC